VMVVVKRPNTPSPDLVAAAPVEARPGTRIENPPPAIAPPAASPTAATPPSGTATTSPAPGTPPGAEAAKPESKVLSPTPAPSQVPAPAPAFDPKEVPKASRPGETVKGDTRVGGENMREGGKSIPATVFLSVDPWGEVFVNGKSQGVTPPKKFIKLEPGRYKIEIRNTTFPAYVQNVDLKARDETTLKHKFQ
jgi:hypothetical protein